MLPSGRTKYDVLFLNWNDDGCTDAVLGAVVYISGCNGTIPTTFTAAAIPKGALDWNGDGRTDLLVANGATVGVYLSTGAGIGSLTSTSVPYSATARYFAFDTDGDGLDDLGYVDGAPLFPMNYYRHNGAATPANLLSAATDAYGNFAKPTYVPITQSSYSQSVSAPTGYKRYRGSQYVVNQVTYNDATSTATPSATYSQTFTYADEMLSLNGRGLTGMRSRQLLDSRNGLWTTTVKELAFPRSGMPLQSVVSQNANSSTLVRNVNYTNTDITLDGTAGNVRLTSYPSHIVDQAYEYQASGNKNGQLVKTTTANLSLDNRGTLTTSTVTVQDNDSGAPQSPQYGWTWTVATTNTPYYDTTNCGVLLSQSQVVYTASNQAPSVTITKSLTPDTAHCRYTQVVTQPSTNYQVTEGLGYDSFGNLNNDTVTGLNMTARMTQLTWGTTGRFLTTLTDPSGAQRTWNYTSNLSVAFGVPDSVTDANGLKIAYQYDGFGRKTQAQAIDSAATSGPIKSWSYALCSGCDPLPRLVVTEQPKDSAGTVITTTKTYLDMLDRPIKTLSTLADGSTAWTMLKTFDNLGRVVVSSFPYQSSATSPGNVHYYYDPLNRVTKVQRLNNAGNSTLDLATLSYQGDTTVSTDALSHSTTRITAADRLVHLITDAANYTVTTLYDAAGTRNKVTDGVGNTLWQGTFVYGIAPCITASTDMDMGTWGYTFNALGEMTNWTDAKLNSFSATYDALSRPKTRAEPDYFTQWTYGATAASHNIGQLQSVCTGTGAAPTACTSAGYSESESYDTFGRKAQRIITIPGDSPYAYTWAYNTGTGLLNTLTYPTAAAYALQLQYGYQYGLTTSVTNVSDSPNVTVWKAGTATSFVGAMNARFQVAQETLGNGIVTNRSFDAVTGFPSAVQAGVGGGAAIQNESYLFDAVGNMIQRQDNNAGLTEGFFYDNVNRLNHSTLGAATNLQMQYDVLGNILSKTSVTNPSENVGTYTYSATRKHAMTVAGSNAYTYDFSAGNVGNGNVITRNGFGISWTSYNYPSVINGPGKTTTFSYAPDRSHYQQVYTSAGAAAETTMYVGGLLEKVTIAGTSDWRHYIRLGDQTVAVIARSSLGTNAIRYVLNDPLGSLTKITDSTGTPYVAESYCPYGARRDATTWSGPASCADLGKMKLFSREGFTGQDMIGGNSLGLIHMNGRVQDSITARFLSADPYIQDPANTQSYNRYSYTYNNPLSFTDPSGFTVAAGGATPTLEEVIVTATRYRSFGIANIAGGAVGGSSTGTNDAESNGDGLEEVVVTATRPKPQTSKSPLLSKLCSIFSKYGYGTAGFTIGDGFAGNVNVTFTDKGISAFVGLGLGGGTAFSFTGGLSRGVSTGKSWGIRSFASASGNIGPVGLGGEFSGGSDGLDVSAGVGSGEGIAVVAGLGVNFNIVDGDPQRICQ